MSFISYSQAGQDRWVYEMLVKPEENFYGTFIDVGANDPVHHNNTCALEHLGWIGLLLEQEPNACLRLRAARRSTVYEGDATVFDYSPWKGVCFDYISLDIDRGTLAALQRLLEFNIRFRVATVEHDFYRFGEELRAPERALLNAAGYTLICEDVCCGGPPFEDWYCLASDLRLMERAERFRCSGKDWREIIHD